MSLTISRSMLLVSADSRNGITDDLFSDDGFEIRRANGGRQGLEQVSAALPAVILADMPLGDMTGIEFISSIREWSLTPIIALSQDSSLETKVALLEAGADDYVVKPFGLDEMRARIQVAFRHRLLQPPESGPVFKMGRTVVDLAHKTVVVGDESIRLAPIEFNILQELLKQAGKVVTQRQLMLRVWRHSSRSNLPVLRAYMAILRKKVSIYPAGDIVIETIPGVGYRLYHTWSGGADHNQSG